MSLRPVKHQTVRMVDIDGTLIKKRQPEDYNAQPEPLIDAVETVNAWFEDGDYIILWTARPSQYRNSTIEMLDSLGIRYHELLCDKPYSHNIHIYDDNPIMAHKIERDVGLGVYEAEDKRLDDIVRKKIPPLVYNQELGTIEQRPLTEDEKELVKQGKLIFVDLSEMFPFMKG